MSREANPQAKDEMGGVGEGSGLLLLTFITEVKLVLGTPSPPASCSSLTEMAPSSSPALNSQSPARSERSFRGRQMADAGLTLPKGLVQATWSLRARGSCREGPSWLGPSPLGTFITGLCAMFLSLVWSSRPLQPLLHARPALVTGRASEPSTDTVCPGTWRRRTRPCHS